MAKSAFGSVDEYLAARPAATPVLSVVRDAIRAALPDAVECISYNIPTYKVGGKMVLYFAGWKNHYSIYPVSHALEKAFAAELADHKVVKSTLQFSYGKPVPDALIGKIAAFRAREVSNDLA